MAKVVEQLGPMDTPCLIFTGSKVWGYGQIGRGGKDGPARVHRVMWEIHRGVIPDGLMVLHKCDVKACCNIDHLYVGTHSDNTRDAVERSRFRAGDENGMRIHPEKVRRGEAHHSATITEELVLAMRAEFDSGRATVRQLADTHRLDWYHVNLIVKRRRWRHV